MAAPALLACDWGTTHLRAWALAADGAVLRARDFPLGVSRLRAGEAEAVFRRDVRLALGALGTPAILCGMVGSTLGWTEVPYVDCPAALADLAAGALILDDGGTPVTIVPGLRFPGFDGQGDVMRGEETQLFGWLAAWPRFRSGRHLVCHPGTHTKWMVVAGRLTAFVTAMTGELFAVLRQHSVLRSAEPPDDKQAFDEGVAAAGDGDALAARLFTARARVVGRGAPAKSTISYLSGLLIGADVASTPRLLDADPGVRVVLLGDVGLCELYARALAAGGRAPQTFDGEAAAVSGLLNIHLARRA